MTDNLAAAVRQYLSASLRKLPNPPREGIRSDSLTIPKNRALELQMLVNELEGQPDFAELVEQTSSTFSSTDTSSFNGLWALHVRNFFRRSNYYAQVFDGKEPDIEGTVHEYQKGF